jgi:hypothetical protein
MDISLDNFIDLLYSNLPEKSCFYRIFPHPDDQKMWLVFNIVLKIFVDGIYKLKKIDKVWEFNINIEYDLRDVDKDDIDMLRKYLRSVCFDLNIDVEKSDIKNYGIMPFYSDIFEDCYVVFIQNNYKYKINFNYILPIVENLTHTCFNNS